MIPEDPVPVSPNTPAPADTEGERPASIHPLWQRLPFTVRRGFWSVGATSAVIGLVYTAMAGGPQRRAETAAPKPAKPAPVASRVVPDPVPAAGEREALVDGLVRSQKKRIMGRKRSLPDVERIVTLVGPLVERALQQPSIQDDLRVLAEQNGMSLAEYKQYFRRMQEADLLLESGGDPDARSPSDAIGVAQFLAGTARASGGLKVNVPESRRLTWRIARLQSQVGYLQTLPEDWTKPLPGAPRPVLIAAAPRLQTARPVPRSPFTSRGARSARKPAVEAPAVPAPDGPSGVTPAAGGSDAQVVTPGTQRPAALEGGGADAAAAQIAASPEPGPSGAGEITAPVEGAAPAVPSPEPVTAPTPTPELAQPETAKPAAPAPQAAPAQSGVLTRDELIAKRAQELRVVRAKRRQVDERYDPAKAIAAQTRYMVRMARRYGSLDWVFQAYHGGEGGVRNTVSYYLGDQWRQFGSPECAIRGVLPGGRQVRPPLSFEDLYFKTTPRTQPAAFSYVYGRSDNHRYYWWKILAAERAIDQYRRDPAEFREQWRALRPGQRLEVVWYPNSKELNFHDVAALKQGYKTGELVRWPASARNRGLVLGSVAPLDPANAFQYKGLRPEALGALYRIAAIYLANGGSKMPLRVHSLVQTERYRASLNVTRPPSWMRKKTEPDEIPIDMQPTGLCFDIERPATAWNRKVLEYALGYLTDRNQIGWVEEREQGPRRYHVCPSPEFRRELVRSLRPPRGRKRV